MLLQIKSSMLYLAAIVADRQGGQGQERRETPPPRPRRLLKSDRHWNLQFCREEAITSQINRQPRERQRRVLHKASDVQARVYFHGHPVIGISPFF